MYGVNDWLSLRWLLERIRLAALGHLEHRGHIVHIKGGWEFRSLRLAIGQWKESGGVVRAIGKRSKIDEEGE